jgi:hypothetical protein
MVEGCLPLILFTPLIQMYSHMVSVPGIYESVNIDIHVYWSN